MAAIDGRLSDIKADHNVHIAVHIESGSRAWGFPSPDSDYDRRFVSIVHGQTVVTRNIADLAPTGYRSSIRFPRLIGTATA